MTRPLHYILRDRKPVAAELMQWTTWFESSLAKRHVAEDTIRVRGANGRPVEVSVSTVFLGLDHNLSGEGPPVLFETMIFGGRHDGYCAHCSTWEEAEAQHVIAMEEVGRPLK